MTPAETLRTVRRLAQDGHVRTVRTIPWQAAARPVSFDDVRNALVYAVSCAPLDGERWRVTGVDLDSEVLNLIIHLDEAIWVEAIEQKP